MTLGELGPLWKVPQVAEALNVTLTTARNYQARGHLVAPDDYAGLTPVWYRKTILDWIPTRKGPGNYGPPSPETIEKRNKTRADNKAKRLASV
jgi:hypothetical protein